MSCIPHSIRVLFFASAAVLLYDLALARRWVDCQSISEDFRDISQAHPWIWGAAYWATAFFFYLHFKK